MINKIIKITNFKDKIHQFLCSEKYFYFQKVI